MYINYNCSLCIQSQDKLWLETSEAYTTKVCGRCSFTNVMGLKTRQFKCKCCGLDMKRDEHSGITIGVRASS